MLNCTLKYEHIKELSNKEYYGEKVIEKVGLPIDVMEVINPDINLGKWIHNFGLVDHYMKQIRKDPTYLDIHKRVQQQPIYLVHIAIKFSYLCKRNI